MARNPAKAGGKTLRRSYEKGGAKAPIHMISAWSARQNLAPGQAKPAPADGPGIARKIIDKGGDDVLASLVTR